MAKKLLFSTFYFVLPLVLSSILTAAEPTPYENTPPLTVFACDAPAPDSFHVESAGTNYINLAWKQVWLGATYTLVVLKENPATNSWEYISTFYNIPGSSYTFANAEYGSKYRFKIATNCASGEPSSRISIIDHIEIILDLTISGRNPISPTVVPGLCPAIKYQEFKWVGFKIQLGDNLIPTSTLYEFTPGKENGFLYPIIKRVNQDGPIFAVGPTPFAGITFPTNPIPLVVRIFGSSSFLVRHYLSPTSWVIVGYVKVTIVGSSAGNTVQICIDDPNWNQAYKLIPLTAQMANGFAPPNGSDKSNSHDAFHNEFKAQNPFNDMLNIFIPNCSSSEEHAFIRLIALNGQPILEHHFDTLNEVITVPTNQIAPGFYILEIETIYETKALKVFKAE